MLFNKGDIESHIIKSVIDSRVVVPDKAADSRLVGPGLINYGVPVGYVE